MVTKETRAAKNREKGNRFERKEKKRGIDEVSNNCIYWKWVQPWEIDGFKQEFYSNTGLFTRSTFFFCNVVACYYLTTGYFVKLYRTNKKKSL